MAGLLAASDQQWSQDNLFVVQESDFVQGAEIRESFTSRQALEWMFAGLLADGVVAEDNASNMSEDGDTTVNFNGISYAQSSPLRFSQIVDHGFTSVTSRTTIKDAGFAREITFWVADKADYTSQQEVFDRHFSGLTDAGFDVVQDAASTGVTWTAGFEAETADRVVELTNTDRKSVV